MADMRVMRHSAPACVARRRLKKLRKGPCRRQAVPAAKPDAYLIFATITAPQYEGSFGFQSSRCAFPSTVSI